MRFRRKSVLLILIAVVCCVAASSARNKSTFKGRIVAYRPADRMQVISFVANRELLLFHVDGKKETLLKLVYVHQGFSDLKDDVLSGAKSISITAHRDVSCDQTLAMFKKDALVVPLKGDSAAATEGVVFTDKSLHLPESYHLECYALDLWMPFSPKLH